MITGGSNFNEVFLDGARTAEQNVVLGAGQGWAAAMALLGLERGDEAATNPIFFRAEVDRLIALARPAGVGRRRSVRDQLARAYTRAEIMRYLGMRTSPAGSRASRPAPTRRSRSSTGVSTTARPPTSRSACSALTP